MWEFFREGSNHAYIRNGNVSFDNCVNTLVISSSSKNRFVNLRDSFVLINGNYEEVFPISDVQNAVLRSQEVLYGQKVHYNIPKFIWINENLTKKDIEKLREEIEKKYGIKPKDIFQFDNKTNKKNGIFYFKGEDGREYVLKFRGKNKEKAEIISVISENIPDYFPTNFHRIDNPDFTFEIGNELYGLEEFIVTEEIKIRNLEYFSSLGFHIGILHYHFSDFERENKEVKRILFSIGSYNKSTMIALYLDLLRDEQKHEFLLSELEKIIHNSIGIIPRSLIHGDLNYSNLIWNGKNPKIIDNEAIRVSTRLDEFVPALLLEGKMEIPKYIEGSLKTILSSHNFGQEEINALTILLKYFLLRNFVIRKIRRGIDNEDYLNKTEENLKRLEEDL